MDNEKKVKSGSSKNRAEALDQKLEQSYNMIKHWIAVRGYQPSLKTHEEKSQMLLNFVKIARVDIPFPTQDLIFFFVYYRNIYE